MEAHYQYTKIPFWPKQIGNLPSQNGILIWTKDNFGRFGICLGQNRIPFLSRLISDLPKFHSELRHIYMYILFCYKNSSCDLHKAFNEAEVGCCHLIVVA